MVYIPSLSKLVSRRKFTLCLSILYLQLIRFRWYWWADVPPKTHQDIYAIDKQTVHGEPSVRHRGIFLNDEAPALTGWVRERFGGYNSKFYVTVFELLLRLKVLCSLLSLQSDLLMDRRPTSYGQLCGLAIPTPEHRSSQTIH